MKKLIICLFSIVLLSACDRVVVYHFGELKQVMHGNGIHESILLKAVNGKGIYALGALEQLQGEVLIWDGKPLISSVENNKLKLLSHDDALASLLVYSKVDEWDTLSLNRIENISETIRKELTKRNITEPSPFIILGQAERLHYHVINFDFLKGDLKNHRKGAFEEDLANIPISVLGFYATNAQGVYTHHGSDLHMHFKTDTADKSGHVDDVDFGNQPVKLLLPKL